MKSVRSRAPFALSLSLSFVSPSARAQSTTEVLRRPVGAPQRVRPSEAIAEVRAFAGARVGERALLCFVQAGQGRERGALKCALVRRDSDGALLRVEPDRLVAPAASAVALAWDASGGMVVWVVPRPHRNESERARAARHRDGARSMQDSLANPLGTPSLTAGDVMAQRIDAAGALVGRPTLVFGENARAYRVTVARDEQGWIAAWTGAAAREGEVRGTIRAARLDASGVLVGRVIETLFSGPTGDALRILPRSATMPPRLVWTGEHCRERPEQTRHAPPSSDPSASIETRPRFMIQQGPPHEHPGPNIQCDPLSLYSAAMRADGTLTPVQAGPALARDALAVVDGRVVYSTREAAQQAALLLASIDEQGRASAPRSLVVRGPVLPPSTGQPVPAGGDDTAPQPSLVRPPATPERTQILRAPFALDAATNGARRALAAVSPTHRRIVLARFDPAGATPAEIDAHAQPVEPTHDLALLGADAGPPWLLLRVGSAAAGPLVFSLIEGPSAPAEAPVEQPWQGDERLRTHLLRARAARAAVTDLDHTLGPLSAQRDAALNPAMPGLVSSMRRLRVRWVDACDALQARARFLVRRGLDRDLETLARQQCEIPPEPAVPGERANGAPSAQGAP